MRSIQTTLDAPIGEAEADVRAALAEQGFGVLTEIDVAATLHAKLGVERPPLKILGACNPHFAHEALQIDPSVALVLPCNVVLETNEVGTLVSVVDPRADERSCVRVARNTSRRPAHCGAHRARRRRLRERLVTFRVPSACTTRGSA